MTDWRKFRRLPTEEKKLFLAALALLPVVRLALKALGLRPVQAALARLVTAAPGPEPDRIQRLARRAARLVDAAARFTGGTCLARSLVLAWLLERRGIAAELRIGVRKNEQALEAHAWVDLNGEVLSDSRNFVESFATFDRSFALARVSWR